MAFRQAECDTTGCSYLAYSWDTHDGVENRFCSYCLCKQGHPAHAHMTTPNPVEPTPVVPVEPPTVSKWVGVPPVADWGEWEW
jgi:hypothetical protein